MANLRYPISPGRGDFIMFTAKEYKAGGVEFDSQLGLKTERTGGTVNNIVLPIQSSITDSNGVDWKEDRLDPIRAAAADFGLGAIKGESAEKTKTRIEKIKEAITNNQKAITDAVGAGVVGSALGVNLLARFSGKVVNPNLELLFGGPQLRSFNFTFFMVPREPKEAEQVKAIILAFKKSMAAKSGSGAFLEAPDIFEIKYMDGDTGQIHQSLNQIKLSALQNMSVDYTPAGTYSTFADADKTMTAYRMTLQFGELDPIYDRDYTIARKTDIGF